MRLKEDRLEAFDLALLLKARVVLEDLAEPLDRLPFAAPHGSPETDEEPEIRHASLLWQLVRPAGPSAAHARSA